MGICKEKDRKGRVRYVCSKYWPDGSGRLRRYAPNLKAARALLTRVETTILDGSWRELKKELSGSETGNPTIEQFSARFIEEYCKPRIRSWHRYELSFESLNQHFGTVRLKDFSREPMYQYVEKRVKEVNPATVNRDIAAVKRMLSYGVECGLIGHNPLARFPLLKVQEVAFNPPTVAEYRALVEAAKEASLSAMIAVMGETAIRLGEALDLKWEQVDLTNRMLTLARTKSKKIRKVPLSDYALHWLRRLVRYINLEHVFVNTRTGAHWVNPDKAFRKACSKVGLTIGFHDLRRMRTTLWLASGVDVRTVKELLGHRDISTTMRYAGYISDHALRSVREAQEREERQAQQEKNRRHEAQ